MNAQRLTALRRLMTELYNCGFAAADGDEEDVRPSELIETDIIMALSELETANAALTNRVADLECWIDCGQDGPCAKSPGCNRHWEERNRELVQRVAELERIVIDLNPEVNLLAIYDMGVKEQLKTEALNRELLEEIEELRAQLAWTPVSAGLPTEPGVYEFYDSLRRFVGWLTLFELRPDRAFPWIDDECIEWNQPEFEAHARSLYTHFRKVELPVCRIELPKDGES